MKYQIILAQKEIGFIKYVSAADELQIIDVFVQPEYRRQGLAEKSLRELFQTGKQFKNVYLEVRVTNLAALNLYQKLGFEKTGTRKNYYSAPIEDAVTMKKSLQEIVV